jgi:hypothetical protein
MELLKKRIATAPKYLIAICIFPMLFYAFGVVKNFDPMGLGLLFMGLIVAYFTLTGGQKSKFLMLLWQAFHMLLGFNMVYQMHFSLVGKTSRGFEILTDMPAMFYWPVLIGLVMDILALFSIIYLLKSKRVQDFYANH